MPELVKLYIRQVAIGFGIAAVFVALLLGFNVANLRSLILNSSSGPLALFLLFFFNGIVFAGVQFAIAIMGMAENPDDGPTRGLRVWLARRRNLISRAAHPGRAQPRPVQIDTTDAPRR